MTAAPADHDSDEITRGLRLRHRRGDVIELRVLGAQRNGRTVTLSGYYTHAEPIAEAVKGLRASGAYTTLQELDPRVLARRRERLEPAERSGATSDADVRRYRWLPFDADPARPSGVSSSDAEHAEALRLARTVRDVLIWRGWPEPLLCDSGNGGHLLWRIDLGVEDQPLVERALRALAAEFGVPGIVIDTSVFNRSRVWKLYGSRSAKGDDTPDRPHRLARVLEAPEPLAVLDREQLAAFAAAVPATPGRLPVPGRPATVRATDDERVDVPAFCQRHGIEIYGSKPANHGGTLHEVDCVFDAQHRRSAVIGSLPNGMAHFHCLHQSCAGRRWSDVRAQLEPDWAARRQEQQARWAPRSRR